MRGAAIEGQLKTMPQLPITVSVAVAETRGLQQARGPHLVRTVGTVGLAFPGAFTWATGRPRRPRRPTWRSPSQFLVNPEISLDIAGFKGKVYSVITNGGGFG
jgi:hypothetical protein